MFNDYPTWEEAVEDRLGYFGDQAAKNRSLVLTKLEAWFGEAQENGPGNYAQGCKYGIGRVVLAKMLNLNPSEGEEALRNLPLTERARRGLELRAQEEREKAEQLREQARTLDDEIGNPPDCGPDHQAQHSGQPGAPHLDLLAEHQPDAAQI